MAITFVNIPHLNTVALETEFPTHELWGSHSNDSTRLSGEISLVLEAQYWVLVSTGSIYQGFASIRLQIGRGK
jgi:hypothetical protein